MGGEYNRSRWRDVGISVMLRTILRETIAWSVTVVAACLFVFGPIYLSAQQNISSPARAYPNGSVTTFRCGFNALAATLTQCQAAPSAGLKLYVKTLHVQTTTATSGTFALQTGTGTNCATGTAALFPMSGTANRFNAPITSNAMATITFDPPIDLPAATALCVIGVATNTVSGQVAGFIAP